MTGVPYENHRQGPRNTHYCYIFQYIILFAGERDDLVNKLAVYKYVNKHDNDF